MIMRKMKKIMFGVWLAVTAIVMQSCLDDDDDNKYINYNFPSAVVTVKPNSDNSMFYMQLDDNTRLEPTNMNKSPFGTKTVRALVNYNYVDKPATTDNNTTESVRYVTVNWLDSIRTKEMAPNLGEENEKTYGKDPVEIVNDWVTVVEDGYITLRLRTRTTPNSMHVFNLVAGTDKDNPYKVVLFHDANGDTNGMAGDGLVAFKLDGTLPDTEGKDTTLTLVWNSYSGTKSTTFKYRTPKQTE